MNNTTNQIMGIGKMGYTQLFENRTRYIEMKIIIDLFIKGKCRIDREELLGTAIED